MPAPSGAPVRPGPSQLRLVVAAGAEQRHVALRADVLLGDALRGALVPVDDPGTLVLDASGARLDVRAPAGDQLYDGAAVHVVRAAPAPSTPGGTAAVARRPRPQPALLAFAAGLGVALAVVALLPAGAVGTLDAAALAAVAVVLAAGALTLAVARVPSARAATLASAALAAAAGAWATAPQTGAERRLALVVALTAAVVVASVRAVAVRVDEASGGAAGSDEAVVVLTALVVLAATQGAALALGWPATAAAALVVGLCPLVLRLAPRLSLSVPDDQLLDVAHVSRSAGSVRAPRARPLGRVGERAVGRTVAHAEARSVGAVVAACVLAAVLLVPVLLAAPAGSTVGWGAGALTACVVLTFTLVPRSTRGTAARWWPRAAAGVIVVEYALLGPLPAGIGRSVVVLVAVVLALALAAAAAAFARSWRSVVASRLGDAVESLAMVLSLPAAAVAADLVDTLRKVTS